MKCDIAKAFLSATFSTGTVKLLRNEIKKTVAAAN